jgi:hypothetical protein
MDTKPIRINFYRYADDPNVAPLDSSDFDGYRGPFKGRWAIMKALLDDKVLILMVSSGQIQISLAVPDEDEDGKPVEKNIYLELEFCRDKECRFPIKDFVQALLSTE